MMSIRHRSSARAFIAALSLAVPCLVACGGGGGGAPPPVTPAPSQAPSSVDAKIKAAVGGAHRFPKEIARDKYRHPVETLTFFGLKDDMTVIELSPGGGWYTAILAPVLREKGKLAVVGGDPNGSPESEGTKNAKRLQERFAQNAAVFDKVETRVMRPKEEVVLGPPGSADMVLTFRNFHNWVEEGIHPQMLAAILKVLKHGGILGLSDHRAKENATTDKKTIEDTGYVPEAFVIKTVEAAGFKLAGKSDVNANPKDTKDWPKGVWTLPPTLEMGETDRAKYEAIGESDRMTLKFVKP